MISDEIIKLSKEIFPELRKGTHLSSDNCKLYQNAIDNQEQLIRIYKSVGFDLQSKTDISTSMEVTISSK